MWSFMPRVVLRRQVPNQVARSGSWSISVMTRKPPSNTLIQSIDVLEVGGVDDLLAYPNRRRRAGEPRAENVLDSVVAEVVTLPEEADLPRAHQLFLEHPPEVVADLRAGGPLRRTRRSVPPGRSSRCPTVVS